MSPFVEKAINFISSPSFELVQTIGIAYIGLLWLAIIIWVTRDSISRSSSLLFQTFAILLNILIPILGVLLYLIIRPSQTIIERYYQDMEQRLLREAIEEKHLEELKEKPKKGKKPAKKTTRKPKTTNKSTT